MIRFDTIKRLVAALHEKYATEKAARFYTIERGRNRSKRWQVAGLYVHESSDSRIVLEAMHYSGFADSFVRVYRESPLKIVFARKASKKDIFAKALAEGAEAFRAHIPTTVLEIEDSIDFDDIPLSESQKMSLSDALKPIPPPFVPDEIQAA